MIQFINLTIFRMGWNRQLVWLSFDALANPNTKRTSLKNQPLQKDVFAAAFSSWCSHLAGKGVG